MARSAGRGDGKERVWERGTGFRCVLQRSLAEGLDVCWA